MSKCLWKVLDFKGEAIDVFDLFKDEPFVFFLDSSLNAGAQGRYSFVGFDPFEVVSGNGQETLLLLKEKFLRFRGDLAKSPSPFWSGIVGYLGYDLGLDLENIPKQRSDDLNLPDCFFGFYDAVITIDHLKQKLYVSSTGLPEQGTAQERKAVRRLEDIVNRISLISSSGYGAVGSFLNSPKDIKVDLKSNFSKDEYLRTIEEAKEYIRQGEIYQVNLSQRFSIDLAESEYGSNPVELYKTLRSLSPSDFSGYMDFGGFQIISSSPERFLRLKNGVIETRPMKGTRPRGTSPVEDRQQEKDLIQSKKDKAELLMITDLERNDLGRVCEFGSVKVKRQRTIEKYRTVFQATSTIEGILRKDKDCFDLLTACFPGGSITGCPKIRAMEIIEKLEPDRRAIYTGALGYISFAGDMDFNILIRTMLTYREKLYFHVGGGIVSDSQPENEYYETLVKAKALCDCLTEVYSSRVKVPNAKSLQAVEAEPR